ncbi:hypothetical protein N183_18620 [Sinorhizobium sp. Sb3]|nr:hypothetical protein N183_18620 [Sinorhizobium sp. Sb3]
MPDKTVRYASSHMGEAIEPDFARAPMQEVNA